MILEQVLQGVSNRCPSEDSFMSILEIESAIKGVLNTSEKPSEKISLKKRKTIKVKKKDAEVEAEQLEEKAVEVKEKKDTKEETVEKEEKIDEESLDKEIKETVEDLREQYGLLEEQNILGVDYETLFSYLERQVNPEEIYGPQEESETEAPPVMSDEEAEKTVQKIQLGYLTGDKDNVSYEEKEKFHHWQEFNKTLLMVYHQLGPIRSDNVNYAAFN